MHLKHMTDISLCLCTCRFSCSTSLKPTLKTSLSPFCSKIITHNATSPLAVYLVIQVCYASSGLELKELPPEMFVIPSAAFESGGKERPPCARVDEGVNNPVSQVLL